MGRRQKKRHNKDDRKKNRDKQRAEAKAELMALLDAHYGLTKHPSVAKAVTKLSKLNPTKKPARSEKLLGHFLAISSPHFPGRLDDDEAQVYKYTLGKLSFGLFEPRSLVCTLRQVHTEIEILYNAQGREEETGEDTESVNATEEEETKRLLAYPLISDLIIHTPKGDLSAILRNNASSYVQTDDRLAVTFLGATLSPSQAVLNDPDMFALWKETFCDAYSKADKNRSIISSIIRYVLRIAMKLTLPSDEDAERRADNSFSFEIKRSPRGYYDVLYLDDELRISRGNRGTVVIMQRVVDVEE